MASITVVVRQITEQLSDSISQLVLYVIVLQEQAAPVPPELPGAINGVAKSTENLVVVAKNVAAKGYNEYPRIKKRIEAAADAESVAKDNLVKSLEVVSSSTDKKKGWTMLLDSCKVIAGKTVMLLQIIYGAEVERIFLASQNAEEALNKLDDKLMDSDPQKFADELGEAGTQALQTSKFLEGKADATENPVTQQNLRDQAKKIEDLTNQLIEDGNGALNEPENQELMQKYKKTKQNLDNELKKGQEALREERLDVFDPFAEKEKVNLMHLGDDAKSALDEVTAAARAGDDPRVTKGVPNLETALNNLTKKAEEDAKQEGVDPARQKQINEASKKIKETLPQYTEAAHKLAQNPKDKDLQDRVNALDKTLRDNIDNLSNPNSTSNAARELEHRVGEMIKAAKAGKPDAVEDAAKNVEFSKGKLQNQALSVARETDDPMKKRQILDSVNFLDELLPVVTDKTKILARTPNDERIDQEVDQTVEQLKNEIRNLDDDRRKQGDAAREAKDEASKLHNAAQNGDKPKTAEAAKNLQQAASKLAALARADANKTDDPIKKKQILNNISEMENLLPNDLAYANELMNNPKDAGLNQKSQAANDKLLNAIDKLDPNSPTANGDNALKVLNDMVDAAKKGDQKKVDELGKEFPKAVNQVVRDAKAEANHTDDPATKKRLEEAISELTQIAPKDVDSAKEVAKNPKDEKANNKLDSNAEQTRDLLNELAGPKALIRQQEQQLRDMEKAAEHGDKPGADEIAKNIARNNDLIAAEGRLAAEKEQDPNRKQDMQNAINNMNNKLLPDEQKAAQAAVQNSKDPKAQEHLKEANQDLKQGMNELLNGQDGLKNAVADQRRDLEKMKEAAKAGDQPTVNHLADRIAPRQEHINKLANTEANKPGQDADRKKQINDAVNELKNDVPSEITAAKEVSKNPSGNKDKLDQLHNKNDDNLSKLGQPQSSTMAAKLGKDLDQLVDAAKKGDQKKVDELGKEIGKNGNKLSQQLKSDARGVEDPMRKKDLLKAADELQNLLPNEVDEAKALSKNPSDAAAQKKLNDTDHKVHDVLSTLGGPKADLSDAIAKHQENRDKLDQAVKNGDKKTADEVAKKLPESSANVARQADKLAEATPDTQQKKVIKDAVEQFKKESPQETTNGQKSAANPNDKAAHDQYNDNKKNVDNALNAMANPDKHVGDEAGRLEEELNKLVDKAQHGDQPGTAEQGGKVAKASDKLLSQARDKASKEDNPVRGNRMTKAIDTLQALIPQEIEAAKAASKNPNDRAAQDKLKDIDKQVKEALNTLKNPDDTLDNTAAQAKKQANELAEAAKKGDQKKVDELSKTLPETTEKLKQHAKDSALESDDPNYKKKINDAISELDKNVPEQIAQAKKTAANPNDKNGQDKLNKETGNVNNAIDKLTEPPIVDLAKQEKEIEDKLARAVKGNDPKAVAEEAKNLLKQQEKLSNEAKNPKHQSSDPAVQKATQNAVNDLNAIIPEQIKAANDLVNNPNDQKAQEKFDKLNSRAKDDLDDIINANQPNPLDDKAKRIADLRNEIDDLMKALKDNPNDPNLKKRLAELTKELDDLANDVEKGLNPTEDDKINALINVENDQLDDVEKAMEAGDAKKTDEALKDLEKTNKELVDALKKEASKTDDPVKKDALTNAAKQLEKQLPNLQKNAAAVAKNPRDRDAKKGAAEAQKEMRKALQIAKGVLKTDPYSDILDAIRRAREGLKKVDDSAKKGDQNGVDDGLKAIQAAKDRLKKLTRDEAKKTDDPKQKAKLDNLVADLDKSHNSLPDNANNAAKSPNDAGAQKKLHDNKNDMEKILDQIADATNAPLLAQGNNVAKQEKRLDGNVAVGNPQGTTEAAKAVANDTKKLADHKAKAAENISDPARKKQLEDAVKRLEENAPKQEQLAKEAASNPNDRKAHDKLDAVTKSSEAALAAVPAATNPSLPNNLAAAAKEEQSRIADNLVKAQDGDKAGVADGNKKIQEKQKEVNDLLGKAAAASTNPKDQEKLRDIQDNLNKLSNQLADATNKAAANPNDKEAVEEARDISRKMDDQLQKAVDTLQDPSTVKALADNKKARNFGAKLGNAAGKDDLDDLLKCARDLSNSMNGLIGQVHGVANSQNGVSSLSKDAQAALDLSNMLKEIESGTYNPKPANPADLDKLLNNMSAQKASAVPVRGSASASSASREMSMAIPEKKTLEDSMETVAAHVHQVTKHTAGKLPDNDPIMLSSNNIAVELAKMAVAARAGDRQGLLISSRTCAAHLSGMHKVIQQMLTKVKDPKLQEKLFKASEALLNFGTQLKILAAVKAAGGDKDSDEQLITLVRNIGYGLPNLLGFAIEAHLKGYFK